MRARSFPMTVSSVALVSSLTAAVLARAAGRSLPLSPQSSDADAELEAMDAARFENVRDRDDRGVDLLERHDERSPHHQH